MNAEHRDWNIRRKYLKTNHMNPQNNWSIYVSPDYKYY